MKIDKRNPIPYLRAFVPLCLCVFFLGCQGKLPESTTVEAIEPFAETPLTASRVLFEPALEVPLKTRTLRYRYVDAEHRDKTTALVYLSQTGSTARRIQDGRESAGLSRSDDGRIMMTEIEKEKHDVLTVFHPPLPVLIPDAKIGKPLTFEGQAIVYKRNNLNKAWSEGPYQLTVIDEGRQTLNLPAGQFHCRRYRIVYEGEFGLATVKSQTITWYASGIGLVAEDYHESGRFLFVPWSESHTMVLEAVEE